MKKIITLPIFLLLLAFSGIGHAQPPAEFMPVPGAMPMEALQVAFRVLDITFPSADGEDWVAAVDADDANILLAVGGIGISDDGADLIGFLAVNPPVGPSNQFHFIYYDASVDMFHILMDDTGMPVTVDFVQDLVNESFVEGYDISASPPMIPGAGTPGMPGTDDINVLIDILPVDLTSFTGHKSGKSVALDWTTASEDGNDNFSIERSADGVEFVGLGEVAGAGTSREANAYTFNDESPLEGQNYYRLRQNDFTGSFSFSNVVVVSFNGGNQTFLEVSPNPASDHLQVKLSGQWLDFARVVLMDMNGKVISDKQQPTDASFDMELGRLPMGIYQLQVTDGKNKQTQRVIIQ
ncbi:MAG: hypothetical protein ACI81P_000211 [Neolewinella sp.]|jgi:hypothetical protein